MCKGPGAGACRGTPERGGNGGSQGSRVGCGDLEGAGPIMEGLAVKALAFALSGEGAGGRGAGAGGEGG